MAWTRITYIVGINKALRVVFPENLACEWMTRPNKNSLFRGETFFAYVAQEGIPGLHQVRMMLDAARAGKSAEYVSHRNTPPAGSDRA
jgi:hypothetical protein